MNKINQNTSNLLTEVLRTIILILTSFHELAEVHLALLSPVFKENPLSVTSETVPELDSITSKLEHLSSSFKVPTVTPSRVTYFYTSDQEGSTFKNSTNASSMSDSMATSGQITPILNDLLETDACSHSNSKSWIVNYCVLLGNVKTSFSDNQYLNKIRVICIELLQIVCKKYFDLLRRDLFFDELCEMILNAIEVASESSNNDMGEQGILQKTLKLLEEFARCLATTELRARNNIDLSDCCKFWLALLNSKLVSQLLCNEQFYLVSSAACDCLASIGKFMI